MKRINFFISALILLSSWVVSASSVNDLVVVVNNDNPIQAMNKKQIVHLYMGKYVAYPNGAIAQPIDGPSGTKELFYGALVDKSLAEINSYWSRVRFTGRASPPIAFNSVAFIQDYMAKNKHAIAYISSKDVTDKMKVVYQFE